VHPMGSKRNFPFATNFVQPLYEELPAEQLQLYLRYQDSSLLFWDRIVAEYPTHLTYLIGDLNLKVANEYVHTYMTLSSVKRKDLGQRYLDQTHYDACYLDIARNMLDACETNGILVTNGDSDSYP